MKKTILSLFLITLAFSYTYKITSQSNCLSYDPVHGVCSKWSQQGTIQQDTSCFIGETLVKQMDKGFIQIKDLQEGDKILTLKQGNQIWSLVQGWLHKNQNTQGRFRKVVLESGDWIGVSEKHNIAFQSQQKMYEYRFMIDEIKGNMLYPVSQSITSSQEFISQGMYAPLTSQSSYLVFTSKSQKPILAHDYANLRNPQAYETVAKTILGTVKIFNGGHILNSDGINVAADWMMDKFSVLMQ